MSSWCTQAIRKIEADYNRSSDTHLIKLEMPAFPGIDLYLKDESTHPTGSLKHRLARSLFLYALCNGLVHEGTTIIESSSGSTAVSEAYFARLLGLPFIAVVPRSTSQQKIDQIAFYGGQVHLVDGSEIYSESARLAKELNGYFMDQFTHAERATDWRGNNNIADSVFCQMSKEPHPVPTWVVMSAGTGGTSATLGRYIRYKGLNCKLCVADPDNSVFMDYFLNGDPDVTITKASNIEGIGRPRVEKSFIPTVIDRMIRIPDNTAIATVRFLEKLLNRRCGGSTGTNLYASFLLMEEMKNQGLQGSVVSFICDSGERYLGTYYNDAWLSQKQFDIQPEIERLQRFYETGVLRDCV